jgi:hypothetical protein
MINQNEDTTTVLEMDNVSEEKTSTPENKSRQARYREARMELKTLSKIARVLVKDGAFNTINEAIIKTCYTDDTHQEFKKFHEWKKEGKMIIKGSKGFPVWTKPIDRNENTDNEIQNPNDENEDSTYWGICYLFSNAQVR